MASEWRRCTIADLGDVITGKTPSTKISEFWDGSVHFVTPKDIQGLKHITDTERKITNIGLQKVKGSVLPPGAVCVSCIGNIGYTGMTTQQCVSNQQINSIIVNENNDPDFVYYLMRSLWPFFKNYEGQSTTLSILNKTQFSKIPVLVPDKNAQKKIAGVISVLDSKIELNKKINDNLQQQIKSLVTAWLVDYIPFGGEMPSNWCTISLATIADFVSGYSYKGAELQPSTTAMATIKNFDRNGGFKLDGFKELVPSSKIKPCHYAEKFDVIVAHTDLTQKAEVIGNAEPIINLSGYESIVFSMDLVKVLPKDTRVSKFLLAALLQHPRFKAHCLGYVNGTTVLHLSKKALPDYELDFPTDPAVLVPLDDALRVLYMQMATIVDENRKLQDLRDTLLPRLMSDQIDVTDIDF